MSQIELRALLSEGGKILFVRAADGSWQLPGGSLADESEDVDAAMGSFLAMYGIASPDIADDFLQTAYVPGADGSIVLNLYAPQEWEGVLAVPAGEEAGWFPFDELGGIEMDPAMREAILNAFGLGEIDEDDALFSQMEDEFGRAMELARTSFRGPEPAPPPESPIRVPPTGDRHVQGLDVLRTLGATDNPAAAFARMETNTPELAGDIVDFALGEVWSHPALDRRTRSLQVVAMLAAMTGRGGPLRSHINGALNHGATAEQIVQTLRMVAVYAGFPAALEAWTAMEDVFKARGIPRPGRPA